MRHMEARQSRRIFLAFVAIPLALATLAGCVRIHTVVSPDGRVRREVRCQVTKEHGDSAFIELQRIFPRGSGWTLRKVENGQTVSFLASSRAVLPEKDPFSSRVSVSRTDEGMKTTYLYEEQLTDESLVSADERPYVKDAEVFYTITMPGKIQESTPPGKSDGNKVTWSLTMDDLAREGGVPITVTSSRVNPKWAGLLFFGIIAAIIVLYVASVQFSVWRRVRAERTPALEEEDAVEVLEIEDEDDVTPTVPPEPRDA